MKESKLKECSVRHQLKAIATKQQLLKPLTTSNLLQVTLRMSSLIVTVFFENNVIMMLP